MEKLVRATVEVVGRDNLVARWVMLRIAYVMAAAPEAVAIAPVPPSIAAMRFSNTSVVGFMRRV